MSSQQSRQLKFFELSTPLEIIQGAGKQTESQDILARQAAGVFYTPKSILAHIAQAAIPQLRSDAREIEICDPFAGDGRLVTWFIEEALHQGVRVKWNVHLWDIDGASLENALPQFEVLRTQGAHIRVDLWSGDTFSRVVAKDEEFDFVITNPPWENLKPDNRDLMKLPQESRDSYVSSIRSMAELLESQFPNSVSASKFAGWGTNLSRVGTEASVRLTKPGGLLGIVLPLSFLADQASTKLREWLMTDSQILDIGCFPAEARPFKSADVGASTILLRRSSQGRIRPRVTIFGRDNSILESERFELSRRRLKKNNHVIPVTFGISAARVSSSFDHLPTFGSMEGSPQDGLWAGREIDETRIDDYLSHEFGSPFVRGRMIKRFTLTSDQMKLVSKPNWTQSPSVQFERIAWRDVSRASQKRRVIATLIPPTWVSGNSLGVCHFRDGDPNRLRLLLGLMSSLPFELQLRTHLATGHVSLASMRMVRIPTLTLQSPLAQALITSVEQRLAGDEESEAAIEAVAALAYGLDSRSLLKLFACFPNVDAIERREILSQVERFESLSS